MQKILSRLFSLQLEFDNCRLKSSKINSMLDFMFFCLLIKPSGVGVSLFSSLLNRVSILFLPSKLKSSDVVTKIKFKNNLILNIYYLFTYIIWIIFFCK